jgi:hypothetical protein
MIATDGRPTVADLCAAGAVAEADLDKAVQAYLDDRTIPRAPLGDGRVVELGPAVEAHAAARALVARDDAEPGALRQAVRAALLAARPSA